MQLLTNIHLSTRTILWSGAKILRLPPADVAIDGGTGDCAVDTRDIQPDDRQAQIKNGLENGPGCSLESFSDLTRHVVRAFDKTATQNGGAARNGGVAVPKPVSDIKHNCEHPVIRRN